MRNHFLWIKLALLLFPLLSYSQNYKFELSNGLYTYFSKPTYLIKGNIGNDTIIDFPIGFSFKFLDKQFSRIYICENGLIKFTRYGTYTYFGFYADMKTLDTISSISYLLTGNAPDRILKIQYRNRGFERDTLNRNYANFQIWLKESDNSIETHFGDMYVPDSAICYGFGETGPAIGVSHIDSFGGQNIYSVGLSGNPSNPVVSKYIYYLSGTPFNGLIYSFRPSTSDISENPGNDFRFIVWPILSSHMLNIQFQLPQTGNCKVVITDLLGKILYQQEMMTEMNQLVNKQINIEKFPNGIFIIYLESGNNLNSQLIRVFD